MNYKKQYDGFMETREHAECALKFIKSIPTAYDVEKVIEELEDMSDELNRTIGCMCPENTFDLIDKAIDTIQELSAKLSDSNLNGGWHVEGGGTKIKVFAWLDVKPYKKEV